MEMENSCLHFKIDELSSIGKRIDLSCGYLSFLYIHIDKRELDYTIK